VLQEVRGMTPEQCGHVYQQRSFNSDQMRAQLSRGYNRAEAGLDVGRGVGHWATRTNNYGPKRAVTTSGLEYGSMRPSPNRYRKFHGKKSFGSVSQQSNVDEAVFGRDIDQSNQAASLKSHKEFAGASGATNDAPVEVELGGGRKNFGRIAQRSTADEAIFGRDLDGSNLDSDWKARGEFQGASGGPGSAIH